MASAMAYGRIDAVRSWCRPAGRWSKFVLEGVGVLAARADDDLTLATDPGQVAGAARLDDLPGHPRDAVRAARFVLQHEAALAAVQRPVDPLDTHVRGGVIGVNRDDVGLAGAHQVHVERRS